MTVKELYIFHEGKRAERVTEAELVAGRGIEGDIYADGGDRQVVLASSEASAVLGAEEGLCWRRFKPNVVLDSFRREEHGIGEVLELGEAAVEITKFKPCFPNDCRLAGEGLDCPLRRGAAFGKVVKSGTITIAPD